MKPYAYGLRHSPGIILAAFLIGILALLFIGPGCRKLAPDGEYKGDKILYSADLTITTSYDLIHTYVTWEYQNRAALAKWPEVKKSADAMRKGAKDWFRTATALREAYASSPTDSNRVALTKALAVLQAAVNEIAVYMAQASNEPITH